jgi:hypothetical protein
VNGHRLVTASGAGFLCLISGVAFGEVFPAAAAIPTSATEASFNEVKELEASISNISIEYPSEFDIISLEESTSRGVKADGKSSQVAANLPPSNLVEKQSIRQITEESHPSLTESDRATPQTLAQLSDSSTFESDSLGQVTNVSQLSDVSPGDWAFEALRSLVERYGCIAGYPDGTFRGNRALSRYEFAAGLNACLQQIESLIAGLDFVTQEDLATLQRLTQEFEAELATLGTRVDDLEGRVAFLEDNQFSTTTKLSGEAIFGAIGGWGGAPGSDDANIILVDRVRLNLTTSFTGRDALITGLQAHNFQGGLDGSSSVQGTLGLTSPILSASSARVGFEPQFPGINPQTLDEIGSNSVQLYKLLYVFPVTSRLTAFAGTAAETSDAFPAVTPFAGEGQEAISRFAAYNPVVRVSGGTSGSGLASGAGFIWNISDNLNLSALYASVNAPIADQEPDILPGVSGTPLGAGLFGGSTVAAAQLTFSPSDSLELALNYANSYHEINILGTGLAAADIGTLAEVPLGIPVKVNSVGGTATFRFTPKIALSGYGAAFFVDDSSGRVDASTTLTSWMVGLHFSDFLKEGSSAGLIFGQPLHRVDADGDAQLAPAGANRETPYHLEAYYRLQLTENISLTPGVFVLFNPESDGNNDTTTVGVLRTTFTF